MPKEATRRKPTAHEITMENLESRRRTTLIRCPGGTAGTYTIPDSVTRIEIDAFSDCAHVTEITVGADDPAYSSLDGVLFNKNRTVLSRVPEGRSGRYTVPDGVRFLSL
jgi:hypothetical protein